MRVSRLIDLYLAHRDRFSAPPSATGLQLEGLRLGTLGTGGGSNAQEEQQAFFAHLAYAWGRLSALEQHVLEHLRTPIGTKPYEREVRDGDLFIEVRDNVDGTQERVQVTHAGETFARSSVRVGFVVVRGDRPVYPTREQAAERLGMAFGEVKAAVKRAYGKLDAVVFSEETLIA